MTGSPVEPSLSLLERDHPLWKSVPLALQSPEVPGYKAPSCESPRLHGSRGPPLMLQGCSFLETHVQRATLPCESLFLEEDRRGSLVGWTAPLVILSRLHSKPLALRHHSAGGMKTITAQPWWSAVLTTMPYSVQGAPCSWKPPPSPPISFGAHACATVGRLFTAWGQKSPLHHSEHREASNLN